MLPSGAIAALQPTLGATVLFFARMATAAFTSLGFNLAIIHLFNPSITATLVALCGYSFVIGYLDTSTTYQRFTLATCAMVLCQWWQDMPQYDATFAVHVGVGHALVALAAVVITALPSPGYASATREVGNRLRLLHFATRNELAALAVAFTHGTELEHNLSEQKEAAAATAATQALSTGATASASGVATSAGQHGHGIGRHPAADYYSKLSLFPELHLRDGYHGHGHGHAPGADASGDGSGSGGLSPASPLYAVTSPVPVPVIAAASDASLASDRAGTGPVPEGSYVPPTTAVSAATSATAAADVSIEMRAAAAVKGYGAAAAGLAAGAAPEPVGNSAPMAMAPSTSAGSVLLFAPLGQERLLQALYGKGHGGIATGAAAAMGSFLAGGGSSGSSSGAAVASSERASLLRADIDALEAFGGEQLGFLSRCLGDMRYEPSLFLSETLPKWLRRACASLACSKCCTPGGCCTSSACCGTSSCCNCCCSSSDSSAGSTSANKSTARPKKLPLKRDRLQAWARAQQALHRVLQSLSAAERHVPASALHALFMRQLRQPLCKLVLDVSRLYGAGLAWSARTRWTRRRGCCSASRTASSSTSSSGPGFDDMSHGTTHWNAWFPPVGYPGEPVPSSHSELLRLRAAVTDDAAAFFASLHQTRLSLATACSLAATQAQAALLGPQAGADHAHAAGSVTGLLSTQRSFIGETSWFALPHASPASALLERQRHSVAPSSVDTGSASKTPAVAAAAEAAAGPAAPAPALSSEDLLALVQAVQRNEASSLLSFLFQSLRCAQIVVDAVNEACALPDPATGGDAGAGDSSTAAAAGGRLLPSRAASESQAFAGAPSPAPAPPAAAVVVPIPIVFPSAAMAASSASTSPLAGSPGAAIDGSINMIPAPTGDAESGDSEAGLPASADASAATLSIAVSPRMLLWTPTMSSEALSAALSPAAGGSASSGDGRLDPSPGSARSAAGDVAAPARAADSSGGNKTGAASASVSSAAPPAEFSATASAKSAAPVPKPSPPRKRAGCCTRFCGFLHAFWLYTKAAWGLRWSWTQARRGLQVSGVMTLSAGLAIAMQLYLFPAGRYSFWAPQTGACHRVSFPSPDAVAEVSTAAVLLPISHAPLAGYQCLLSCLCAAFPPLQSPASSPAGPRCLRTLSLRSGCWALWWAALSLSLVWLSLAAMPCSSACSPPCG